VAQFGITWNIMSDDASIDDNDDNDNDDDGMGTQGNPILVHSCCLE
jgi:hypothetical protein